MPTPAELMETIETFAPRELAEDWDNTGLLVSSGREVTRALLALDITPEVVAEAQELGCEAVVAHHPVIFRPMKAVQAGSAVYALIAKGISALCAHTNLDAAEGGVNDALAAVLGVRDTQRFLHYAREGRLERELAGEDFARHCAGRLGAAVQYVDGGRPVRRVAVLGGACDHPVAAAKQAGIDAIVTGEASHHDGLEAEQAGITLVVAGHYATEAPVLPVLAEKLRAAWPDCAFLLSERGHDPYKRMIVYK